MLQQEEIDRRFVWTAILVILRILRRKGWLNPADMTELRVALDHRRAPENLTNKYQRLLDETVLEREEKRETPRKPN